MSETYYSRVYTDRPAYADFEPAQKFQAIQSIIAKRLKEHPNAICSYSGGSDSDIMIDLIERPLYYVSNKDKAWYKDKYGIRYSDAYEVYGLTRTGCCGCPISYKAIADLEMIRPYEPNVVKAAWNIFGKSYEYRLKYNEYKAKRMEEEKRHGQFDMFADYGGEAYGGV
jgi:3'-phosphoadenosine 5'-phosphosulfate sulfotransferase (PAPS reductase)/FAD synthetase